MGKIIVMVGLYSNSCDYGYDITIGSFDNYDNAKTEVEKLLRDDFAKKIIQWGADEDDDICYVDICRLPNGFGKSKQISAYWYNKELHKWVLMREDTSV